jgi:hypothetical protein
VSRYVKQGKLISNGKKHKHFRVFGDSIRRMSAAQFLKQLRKDYREEWLAKGDTWLVQKGEELLKEVHDEMVRNGQIPTAGRE